MTSLKWAVQVKKYESRLFHFPPLVLYEIEYGTALYMKYPGLLYFYQYTLSEHLKDHTEYAYWLGSPVLLKLSVFK